VPAVSNPNAWTNSTFPYSAPRFGAVWQASPNIAIRASAGGGYALPQLYNLTGTPPTLDLIEYTQTIPNPNLKPEESFGFDVGTDMRFHRTTVLSFDLYRTNLYGQFFTNTTTSTLNGLPLYITQFGNLGTSRMEGINLDIRHDVPSGYYWHGTLGFTRGYVVSLTPGFYNSTTGFPPTPCTNCTNQTIIPGANFNSAAYSGGVPYASASAEIGYRWNPGKYVDLAPTYYGNNNIYNEPAFVELDAHAGYPLTKNVSLLAIFRNITGIYDQSYQVYNPTYTVPTIHGATGYYQGALFGVPYGPRSVIVTANFKF
jgi:outer membrane receptor protein involved in Fe transport